MSAPSTAAVALLACALAGCEASTHPPASPAVVDTHVAPQVAADVRSADAPADSLPPAVAATHARLLAAAEAGDWAVLGAEAAQTGPAFDFSFAEPGGSAVAYWRATGDSAAFFWELARVLRAEPHPGEGAFTWPRWAGVPWDSLSADDLRALEAFVGAEAFEDMADLRAYIGMRTAINSDGTWAYYIGGD